jgi:GABA permease
MRHVLVVASRTAAAEELREALLVRAAQGPVELTLLYPAPDHAGEAGALLRRAVERLRAAGLDVAGQLGEADPYDAVAEIWDPAEFDEILVSTLPPERSHWLALDLPARLEQLAGVRIAHVVATPGG